ncbi:MAG: hypothetical protein Ta2G_07790 [Termitinemataceae bacterium]|nr:MAG: hypothetical protein Ta2G_07790 [Termitinemataceae bacterium]
MHKRAHSYLFIAGATIVNIVITVVFFVILFLVYFSFVEPFVSESYVIWGIPIIFILAILLSFLVYGILIRTFFEKVDLRLYFDPLLGNFEPKETVKKIANEKIAE